jgi:hypothetical protein
MDWRCGKAPALQVRLNSNPRPIKKEEGGGRGRGGKEEEEGFFHEFSSVVCSKPNAKKLALVE